MEEEIITPEEEVFDYHKLRYILDKDGYVCHASLGGFIVCSLGECTEYKGEVPNGYETIEEWHDKEIERLNAWKIVDGNLVFDENRSYKLKILYEQQNNENSCVTRKEMGMASTEEINPYTDLFPSHESAGGYIVGVDEAFNKVGNLPTEEVNLSLLEEQDLDLIELEFIGNNFLPNTASSGTNNGITYTQNKDKTINVSGTATDKSTLNLAGTDTSVRNILTFKANEQYYLYNLPNGVKLEFYKYDGTDRTLIGIYNGGIISFEEDVNVTQVVLSIDNGTTINTTLKPMIALLEYPLLSMEKYEGNLAPTNASSWEQGAVSANVNSTYSNCKTSSNARIRTQNLIDLDVNKTYTISCASGYYFVIQAFGSGGTLYTNEPTTNTWKSGTLTFSGIPKIAIAIRKSDNTSSITPSEISNIKLILDDGRNGKYYIDGISTQETIASRNLLDFKKIFNSGSNNGLKYTKEKDYYLISGTSTNYSGLYSSGGASSTNTIITLKSSHTYRFLVKVSNNNGIMRFYAGGSDNNLIQITNINNGIFYTDYSPTSDIAITQASIIGSQSSGITQTNTKILVALYDITNGVVTDYEPYDGKPSPFYPSEIVNTYKVGTYNAIANNKVYTITLEEDLRGLSNGVGDRLWLDVDNGIDIERKVGRTILDGSETWNYGGSTGIFYITSITDYAISNNIPYSNYYKGVSNVSGASGMSSQENNTIGFINQSGNTTPRFYIKDTRYTTNSATDLKTWLSTNNVEVYYALATYTIDSGGSSFNSYEYEEYKNNTTLIDLAGNEFAIGDKITIKDNQIVLNKGNKEIYLGDTIMPRTYTPYTHAYCHQPVFIDFKYKDPRNVDITKISLKGLIQIMDIESVYNFTEADYIKVRDYIMGEITLTDEELEYYDVNGDGRVTSSDYILIKNMIHTYTMDDVNKIISYANGTTTLTSTELAKYDVNGDGVVDKVDAASILRMIYNYIDTTIRGTLEINTTKSQRVLVLRDEEGKIKTSIGLNGMTTPSISTDQFILEGTKQPKIMSGITLPEEVTEGAVFLLYDE